MLKALRQTTLHRSVAVRLAASITLIVVLGMSLLATHNIRSQSGLLRAQINETGHLLAQQLALASTEPLFTDRQFELDALVRRFAESPVVSAAAIHNHHGERLSFGGTLPADGEGVILIEAPISFQDAVGGHVLLALSDQPIRAAQREILGSSLMLAALLCLLLSAVAIVLGRRLARPIHTLMDATRLLQQGRYTQITERRDDEFGQLIDVVNKLGDGLVRKAQVEDLVRQFLDRDVAGQLLACMEPVRLGGDRVEATVMFADIVGFTAMSEKLSPEEVSQFLNEYFHYFNICSRFFFGTVDKFIGDAVMIVFGAPRPDPRHRYHAVACAVLMQRLAKRLNVERRRLGLEEVTLRIGLNSGEMLAGMVGSAQRLEYTVVGDAVNLASRLCNEANGSQIIIEDSLYRSLSAEHRLRVESERRIRLRGKQQPVTIHAVADIDFRHPIVIDQLIDDVVQAQYSGKSSP